MTTVNPAEARPYTGARTQPQVDQVSRTATQKVRQVTQENGLCLANQVLYQACGRTWYSAIARAVSELISRGYISVSMGLNGGLDFGLGLVNGIDY